MEEPSEQRLQTICLAVIATAVATYMVYWLRPVLVPFVLALLVVSGVTPLLELTERTLRVNRLTASVLAFITGLFVLGILCVCLWISVQQIRDEGLAYRQRVGELVAKAQVWMEDASAAMTRILPTSKAENEKLSAEEPPRVEIKASHQSADAPSGLPAGNSLPAISALPADSALTADNAVTPENTAAGEGRKLNAASPELQPAENGLQKTDAEGNGNTSVAKAKYMDGLQATADVFIREGLTRLSAELFSILSTSVVVLIYVFFILLGSAERPASLESIRAVDRQVRSYLSLKTVISILTGVSFGAVLWLFGVPMSLTFGLLAFLLNYIPNIGPIVASLLPVPFILLAPEGTLTWMIAAISVTMAVQVISGSVIEPKLMGESSDLHPVAILLALMFWGMMWGITGMFLATPITAGIKIVMESNATTRPLAGVLAGRWGAEKQGARYS